ncbi:MAG: FAD-dependent oxidoreductase, partial [Pseudomonadota bacterium]
FVRKRRAAATPAALAPTKGFEGAITLIDQDRNAGYERPYLSKNALTEPGATCADFALLTQNEICELSLDAHFGARVEALSPHDMTIRIDGGGSRHADRILLATGGLALRLPIPGADLRGVHVLRNYDDATALRNDLQSGGDIAVIGGGLIGAETVASLISLGLRPLWIDAAPAPLTHCIPRQLAAPLTEELTGGGAELLSGVRLARFEDDGRGRVAAVHFGDGRRISANTVVLGVGMAPAIDLARYAGLDICNDAICVDPAHQTSHPGVYAAGDAAAVRDASGRTVRREHWRSAEFQGQAAADAMLGEAPEEPPIDWFWSDQGANHIEMAGRRGAVSIVRETEDWPVVFETENGRIVRVASVNNPNAVRIGLRLIRNGMTASAEALSDPSTDLRQLLRA